MNSFSDHHCKQHDTPVIPKEIALSPQPQAGGAGFGECPNPETKPNHKNQRRQT
jgi:hypothetical protein